MSILRHVLTRSFIMLICLVLVGLIAGQVGAQDSLTAQTTGQLNVRTGPGTEYVVVASLPTGTSITLEARNDDASWVLMHTDGDTRGWVSTCCLSATLDLNALPLSTEHGAKIAQSADTGIDTNENTPPASLAASGTASVTTALRMREEPGEDGAVVTVLARGVQFAVEETSADGYWARVRAVDGSYTGWVSTCCLAYGSAAPPAATDTDTNTNVSQTGSASPTVNLNMREAPDAEAEIVTLLLRGTALILDDTSADGYWVRARTADGSYTGWVSTCCLSYGSDAAASDDAATAAPEGPSADWQALNIISGVGANVRAIYERGLAMGNNPHAFSKVGDCNSQPPFFLANFDSGVYNLGAYAHLQPTIDHFFGSFSRYSVTVWTGNHTWMLFEDIWADPDRCEPGETPIACEYRIHRPSVVLIGLGTNEMGRTALFAESLRETVEYWTEHGVIPILRTKADHLEGANDANNTVIRQVAAEYGVPLWDFGAIADTLPGNGLSSDGTHLGWMPLDYTDARALYTGHPVQNLTALMALDAVLRGAMY